MPDQTRATRRDPDWPPFDVIGHSWTSLAEKVKYQTLYAACRRHGAPLSRRRRIPWLASETTHNQRAQDQDNVLHARVPRMAVGRCWQMRLFEPAKLMLERHSAG
jgi:hypothetical protein